MLADKELQLLKQLARYLIPADPEKGLPGADAPEIFGRFVARVEERAERLLPILQSQFAAVMERPEMLVDEEFAAFCSPWVSAWPAESNTFLARTVPLLLQSYYEDFSVQQLYERRPGAPFPEGYTVVQGDWSLLDQVREQPLLYRPVKQGVTSK